MRVGTKVEVMAALKAASTGMTTVDLLALLTVEMLVGTRELL